MGWNEAPERLLAFSATILPRRTSRFANPRTIGELASTIATQTSVKSCNLTLMNLFYSILHNFLNLEIVNNFILEEDYKLRAAMYDVEPRAPR